MSKNRKYLEFFRNSSKYKKKIKIISILFISHSELNGAPYDYRNHYEAQNDEENLQTRMNDLKNRIELRRMLSEYMSGSLKPPIFYKDGIAAPEDFDQDDEVEAIESMFKEQQPQIKRFHIPSHNNEVYQSIDEADNFDTFPLKSNFRENQRFTVEDIEEEFDPRNNDPNEYHRRLLKANRPKEQSAVYAEGGLVYGPSTYGTSAQHQKRKSIQKILSHKSKILIDFVDTKGFNRTSLLEEVLGFTRHERLDVKKPGPPADVPLEGHPAINATAPKTPAINVNDGLLPKIKKVLHLDIEDDHAPHSVDTQFAHVILKTP